MGKSKTSPEFKIMLCQKYLHGEGSYGSLSKSYGIGQTALYGWIKKYREHGESCFYPKAGNAHYTKQFKIKCVEEVLLKGYLVDDIVAKYNISGRQVLRSWILKYNANTELKDYDPKREVYMAEARRKTTLEERRKIVKYCIAHGNDYTHTAAYFDVSYTQVYSWVKKYQTQGEEGLRDKRGHHKTDEEVNELERLRRENARLKKKLEENDMLEQLLKKVEEFGGR